MSRIQQLVESSVQIQRIAERAGVEVPKKIRLRICRVGPECPACGGGAWIRSKKQNKPTQRCAPRRMVSDSARRFRAAVSCYLPASMLRFVSF